jgi:hypothetical protein
MGYRSVERALEELSHQKRIERHGRGWRVPPIEAQGAGGVLFVGPQPTLALTAGITERAAQFSAVLERDAGRSNTRLHVMSVEQVLDASGTTTAGIRRLLDRRGIIGVLVAYLSLAEPRTGKLFELLSRCGRPHAFLSAMDGASQLLVGAVRHPPLMVCIEPHRQAGRAVASHLLGLGHRRVAYVSPYARFSWCVDRLAGLSETFAAAGLVDAVAPYTLKELEAYTDIQTLIRSSPQYVAMQTGVQTFERAADTMLGSDSTGFFERVAMPYLVDQYVESKVKPLCAEALGDTQATAWVAANDMVAHVCLRFLADQRKRVPQDVSVVGFDDIPSSGPLGLSSYAFNVEGVVREGLRCVLHPKQGSAAWESRIVEIPGMVVARGSSGTLGRKKR